MSAVIPSRLAALTRLRFQIFETSYNPTSIRTGAKYLRARLRGPSMVKYYPPEIRVATLARQYPELELVDEDEEQRLQDVEDKKKRGKGPPKKAKTKGMTISDYPVRWFGLNIFSSHYSRQQENCKETVDGALEIYSVSAFPNIIFRFNALKTSSVQIWFMLLYSTYQTTCQLIRYTPYEGIFAYQKSAE
jgi:small subunit ribosomal protein S33